MPGLRACAIEASSIGIDEHRLDGTRIPGTAIFTNLTHDHLDYHGTMDGLLAARKTRVVQPGPDFKAAVVNMDDAKGVRTACNCSTGWHASTCLEHIVRASRRACRPATSWSMTRQALSIRGGRGPVRRHRHAVTGLDRPVQRDQPAWA
jgi:UDP-N-acetylmuramyl tripeptide synthase